MSRKVFRALISVYDKNGLEDLAAFLVANGVELIATSGVKALLKSADISALDVSDITHFPQILGDRVKTLHPKIHGGILADRSKPDHMRDIKDQAIPLIDLVISNLYPFERNPDIETIDIGGPALIRAASKNFHDVCVITNTSDYDALRAELTANDMQTTLGFRQIMAHKAFKLTAQYDTMIAASSVFGVEPPKTTLPLFYHKALSLRYGENNHQDAAFYTADGMTHIEQVQGKELSYNNIMDASTAIRLAFEFSRATVAIIKHNTPCGVASADTVNEAYTKAMTADPISAFGGIVASNRSVNVKMAEQIVQLFTEVIIAPDIDENALPILMTKKNMRVVRLAPDFEWPKYELRSAMGGILMQDINKYRVTVESDMRCVTKKSAAAYLGDAKFAYTVCKYVSSNAIVVARDEVTIAIGCGQTSRIDSVKIALDKGNCSGATMASDGFFPFSDSIVEAGKAGIACIIQPGGSINDTSVIKESEELGIAMLITGVRCFKH